MDQSASMVDLYDMNDEDDIEEESTCLLQVYGMTDSENKSLVDNDLNTSITSNLSDDLSFNTSNFSPVKNCEERLLVNDDEDFNIIQDEETMDNFSSDVTDDNFESTCIFEPTCDFSDDVSDYSVFELPEEEFDLETYICAKEFDLDEFISEEIDPVYENNVTEESFDLNSPIFPGSLVTVGISIYSIMTYAVRHSLSGVALDHLLDLVKLHCPIINKVPSNIPSLKSWFKDIGVPTAIHSYCPYCENEVDRKFDECQSCNKSFAGVSIPFFVTVDIPSQLKRIFSKPGYLEDIKTFRFQNREPGTIKDIYDGAQYKKHEELQNPNNISFLLNTDGVPVFKSSSKSIWPVFLSVNELPPSKRFLRGNQITAGIWFSEKKPKMQVFLKPIVKTLSYLEETGFEISPINGLPFNCKCLTIAISCDLPAKCMVYNTKQFNGFYGCHKCEIEGESIKKGKGYVRYFPYKDSITATKRTKESYLANAEIAIKTGKCEKGVFGPSVIANLKALDVIQGDSVDYMHKICQGDMRQLLNFWFEKSCKEPYNICSKIEEVNSLIKKIRLPNDFERLPRPLEDRVHFKASEMRTFLLFYGPVVLYSILPQPYYGHFLCLSEAIHILLGSNISIQSINYAKSLIDYFSRYFEVLYGKSSAGANFHQHMHLIDNVLNLGPLWTSSCFHFEDMNGYLLKMIHGTRNVAGQITSAIDTMYGMSLLEQELSAKDEAVINPLLKSFVTSVKHQLTANHIKLNDGIYAVGKTFDHELSKNEWLALLDFYKFTIIPGDLKFFKRIRLNNQLIYSKFYTRCSQRDNSCVLLNDGRVAVVIFFMQHKSQENLALLQVLNYECVALSHKKELSHLKVVSLSDTLKVTKVEDIRAKCCLISCDDFQCVAFLPNLHEKN